MWHHGELTNLHGWNPYGPTQYRGLAKAHLGLAKACLGLRGRISGFSESTPGAIRILFPGHRKTIFDFSGSTFGPSEGHFGIIGGHFGIIGMLTTEY